MPLNALKRRPLGGLAEFRRFLYNAFILPWRDPKLAYLYLTSLLFAFSFAFLDLFILIDLLDLPPSDMMLYLVIKNVGISLTVITVLIMIARFGGKVLYPFITAMMAAGILYALIWQGNLSPVALGLIFVFTNSSFWALYHVFFAISISDENVGNEVALAGTGLTVGSAVGYFSGGLMQALDVSSLGIVAGFTGMAAATILLMFHAHKMRLKLLLEESGALDEKLPDAFIRCKYRSIGTILESAVVVGGSSLWIIFLSMAGISAAIVGVWNALMVLVKIFFTPIAGSLINHGQRREMLMGSTVTAIGWIPFALTATFAFPAMYIWSVGNQLFSAGLGSAWYKTRTLSSLIAREIILAVARLIFIPLMIWLLYMDPAYFVYFMIGVSVLMVVYSLYWMRSIRIKGPVMPIETIVQPR